MLSFSDVLRLTGGKSLQPGSSDSTVQYLLIDSRQLSAPLHSVFFAIRGEHHNGHQFIGELYQRGVRMFVVERQTGIPQFAAQLRQWTEASFIEVESSIRALQEVAAFHRSRFSIPVVGITGSNGKTIVKEWLAQLLQADYRIVKSPKSYNSQVGVPLSVWQINESHTLGIFEAGISLPGEMQRLQRIIQPTIGLFTNIGTAHDEGFSDRRAKVAEKMQLFSNCKTLIYCKDHALVEEAVQAGLASGAPFETFAWSKSQAAPLRVENIRKTRHESVLQLLFREALNEVTLPFVDDASIENVLHCVAAMLYLGIGWEPIRQRLLLLRPVAMRLELKEGINGSYVIDDAYNNDLAGLTMALDFLNLQKQRTHKVLILSDVLETGLPETALYMRIAELLREKRVDLLVGVGEELSRHQHLFPENSHYFTSTQHLLNSGVLAELRDSLILVKGARKYSFERIVDRLQQKSHGTVLEVNLNALSHNLNYYRQKLGHETKIMVMVKAFAYGSGSAEVASWLQFHRVDYLAVAYADEGVALREKGIRLPIMVMNPAVESFHKLLTHQLEPEIYSFRMLEQFLEYLTTTQQTSAIHLKLDTGMHRLGFEEADIAPLLEILRNHPALRVASVFTHLAAADEPIHHAFTIQQLSRFTQWSALIGQALQYPFLRHALNSAGIARFTQFKMDMARLGIGLYGVSPYPEDQEHLLTVGTLKTVISQIKHLKAGETVGYSRRGVAFTDITIATIAIGYADGYDRRFGNGVGKVLVNGVLCPTIGSICMDMCMIDISATQAQEGDSVVIFGAHPTISELSHSIGTIPYEILTSVGERVKRVFFHE